jgi:reactive intermediate/imine deaminase
MKKEIDPGWGWHKPFAYSQAIRFGELLFVSGQAAIAEDGSIVGSGDFQAQARQAMMNLAAVLEAAGGQLSDVLKVTIFVTDMKNFPAVVALRQEFFTPPYPADSIVEVRALALPELLVEIEAVAGLRGEGAAR